MFQSRFLAFIPVCALGILAFLSAQDTLLIRADRVQLKLDTEEAEGVLDSPFVSLIG